MARGSLEVTYEQPDTKRLPDLLTPGAALLFDLQRRGTLAKLGERLRIRRQGGYSGLDVWLVLLLFFSTGAGRGIRKFWEVVRPHVSQLAALCGRRLLATPASVSRALDAVELDLLRAESLWLLADVPEIEPVLKHPAVQTYDARGGGWHVFDLDPTVTTLRQRALPVDDDLPEPRRRSKDTGAPGHSGRKRGDIQFRRVTVQHSGSGLWVHAHLSAGNGEGVVDFERALDTIVTLGTRLEHPRGRTLVRMDGEYGNIPWFTACRERGLPFVTRLNRPKLYNDVEVLARLRSAIWYRVPDSGVEPRRAAADLGELLVHAGKQTRRPDGGQYEPVRIRVVASIFQKTGDAKRGRTIDGWQVELFAVDLPADAWPAADAVATYFGRTAEENRFAQEDRELGLDRILSYHLPGQELASLVGLSLWNLRLVGGFALDTPPPVRPTQAQRTPQVDERVPRQWPRDPVIRDILNELDWAAVLVRLPGWTWDKSSGMVRCPEGRELALTTVRSAGRVNGATDAVFRRPTGGCEDCASRPDCLQSDRALASKHIQLAIPTEIADRLRQRLRSTRGTGAPTPARIEPISLPPGPLAVAEALFLPAAARQLFAALFLGATLRVEVTPGTPEPPRPRLVASDVAERQRRRKTWAQNVARYAAPTDTDVRVEVAGTAAFRRMLGETEQLASARSRVSR